jgi:hypothetical protein
MKLLFLCTVNWKVIKKVFVTNFKLLCRYVCPQTDKNHEKQLEKSSVSMNVPEDFREMSCVQVSRNLRNDDLADCFKSDFDCLSRPYVLYYIINSGQ